MDEQKRKRTYEKNEERTLTGKEYLIDYIQNHSSEEIYDLIKDIEEATLEYTDSRLAFIDFLNDYNSLIIKSSLEKMTFVQNKYGQWILMQGEEK